MGNGGQRGSFLAAAWIALALAGSGCSGSNAPSASGASGAYTPEPAYTIEPAATDTAPPPSTQVPTASRLSNDILAAMSPVVSGRGVSEAAPYDPKKPGPHPVVLLTTAGAAYDDWNESLPSGWAPSSVGETELVAVVGPEREILVGTAPYFNGPSVSSYRFELGVDLHDARTGRTIATYTLKGRNPYPYPYSAPPGLTRIDGSKVSHTDLEDWLCPRVQRQVCWTPVQTLEAWQTNTVSFAYGSQSEVSSVAFATDGRTLVGATNDEYVDLWDTTTWSKRQTGSESVYEVDTVAISPDGRFVAGGSWGDLTIWDAASGTVVRKLMVPGATGIAFSPNGRSLVSAARDGSVILWDTASWAQLRTIKLPDCDSGCVDALAYSPDGRTLASWSMVSSITFWDTATWTIKTTIVTPKVVSVAFSRDWRTVAGGSTDGSITLWDTTSGAQSKTFAGSTGVVESIAFSPDGRSLAGSTDAAVIVWDIAKAVTLRSHGASHVRSISISPDGKSLAAGTSDGTVLVFKM